MRRSRMPSRRRARYACAFLLVATAAACSGSSGSDLIDGADGSAPDARAPASGESPSGPGDAGKGGTHDAGDATILDASAGDGDRDVSTKPAADATAPDASSDAPHDAGSERDAAQDAAPDGGPSSDAGVADASRADGGFDGGVVTGIDVSSEVQQFDDALAGAICARMASCCTTDDVTAAMARFGESPYVSCSTPGCAPAITPGPTCKADLSSRLHTLHSVWAGSVARGNMSFDRGRAAACVLATSQAACGTSLEAALFDDACFGFLDNRVFDRIAPTGAACQPLRDSTFVGECDPKFGYCDFKNAHACVPWRKIGESCTVGSTLDLCARGLDCDGSTVTKPGTCVAAQPPLPLNGTCTGPTVSALRECPATQYCDPSTKLCTNKKSDGAACASSGECATERPFSCYPPSAGRCGSTAFCDGRP